MPVDNNERVKWFSALVVLTGMSGAGGTFIGAPDRFTGVEGKELEERIRKLETSLPPKKLLTDVEVLKERVKRLEKEYDYHK